MPTMCGFLGCSREWVLDWLCLHHWALGISDCPVGRSRELASAGPKDLPAAPFCVLLGKGALAWRAGPTLYGICVPGPPFTWSTGRGRSFGQQILLVATG